MKQGRNSNGNPRAEKYLLDLDELDGILVDKLIFPPVVAPVVSATIEHGGASSS